MDRDEYDDDEYDLVSDDGSEVEVLVADVQVEPAHVESIVELLKRDDVFKFMKKVLAELAQITNLSNTVLRVLLNEYRWDKDRLLERFYDDPDKLLNGIICKKKDFCSSIAECNICMGTIGIIGTGSSNCGHVFCKDCYSYYLKEKIITDAQSSIQCPAYKCFACVEDEQVMDIFSSEPLVIQRYQKLLVDSFVTHYRLMLFCSSPNCEIVFKINAPEVSRHIGYEVNCTCGESLCSNCGDKWHCPVQCKLLKEWKKKCEDDSETFHWIHANTKDCPKCQATIEKDGGCNHVICRNSSCRYEFCWVCLGAWKNHGSSFYNCNRYNEEMDSRKESQEKSRMNLNRYVHYYNRQQNHHQSLQFEYKLKEEVNRKIQQLMGVDMSWVEVQFLNQAVEILRKSRQCLMFTYVFAFYLKSSNATKIFEDNQGDLELATEALSGYLERELPEKPDDIGETKRRVQDKARYCEERSRRLIEHVFEGFTYDSWQYTVRLF